MNLYIGIIIGIIGLVIAVLGFVNILPNMGSSGVLLILSAGLIIGLSLVPKPESEDVNPMPVWEKIIKMFFSPAEVFKNLKSHPTWLVAILVASIFSAVYTTAFFYRLTPERITTETNSKLAESGFLDEKALAGVKKSTAEINSSPIKPLGDFINGFVLLSFLAAFLALIFFVGVLAFGGKINYLQALAVAAYSMLPVTIAQKTISMLLLFLKDPVDIHPIIGQTTLVIDNFSFLVSAADKPVIYSVLASLSLLMLYWVWLMSLGLRKTAEKIGSTTGWVIPLFIWLTFTTLGIIGAVLFGKFLS